MFSAPLLPIVFSSFTALGALAASDLTHPPLPEPHRTETQSLQINTPEPPPTEVRVGDLAPDFSFQGADGKWRKLRDLLWQGRVVLIFGARERELRALERERERLADLGVLPVTVLDMKSKTASALVQRLDLGYTVLSDPRRVIAAQFNLIENVTQTTAPAWFAIDQTRRVRGLNRGTLPLSDWPELVSRAFGLPLREATVPAAR